MRPSTRIGAAAPITAITLVRLENDRIADWREYQYPSDLDWEAFSAANRF